MDPRVATFRQSFRRDEIRPGYSAASHLALTFGLGTAVILLALVSLHEVRPLEWVAVPLTWLYANLSEYFGHRGPMHHPWRGLSIVYRRHAGQHHRFFTAGHMEIEGIRDLKAVLFPAVMMTFFLLAFAAPIGLFIGWLFGSNVAWLFIAAAMAYFLNYELLHLLYHLPQEGFILRLPWLSRLRRLHQAHHDPSLMARYNFNITYPVGDLLFGTLWRGDERAEGTGRAGRTGEMQRRSDL